MDVSWLVQKRGAWEHVLLSIQFLSILHALQNSAHIKTFLEQQLPAALDMLRQMVEINSYTANPAGVNRLSRLTADCFAELGFKPEFVSSRFPGFGDHLVMTRPGKSAKNIALISHLDTVFPPEEEKQNNFHWL